MSEQGKSSVPSTPWAPSQHAGMRCACIRPDALDCVRARTRCGPPFNPEIVEDEPCDCCCHDQDIDEDEGYLDEYIT